MTLLVAAQPFQTFHAMGNWIYHAFGFGGSGPFYGFWSGFGSDLSEPPVVVASIMAIVLLPWHLNCGDGGHWPRGCKSMLTHKVEGNPFRACHKHHPVLSRHPYHGITAEIMALEHKAHLDRIAGVVHVHNQVEAPQER
jgi:hypothetical protein